LPLIKTGAWWIRIFDFPRFQIAVVTLLALLLAYFYVDFKWIYKLPLLIITGSFPDISGTACCDLHPLSKPRAKDSNKLAQENSSTLLVSNVHMDNKDKESFYELVKKYNPDILLINEPDQEWAVSIGKLDDDFPYSIKYPLDNTYGMMLLSKLPMTDRP
jgi:endonuclease/exonuclease/phosphatase (EEP) superfamily protein YafD